MYILFCCGRCGGKIKGPYSDQGETAICPHCEAELDIPLLPIGPHVVCGGFLIRKQLGEGSMGRVYLARELSSKRVLALKILASSITCDEPLVQRFLKEAALLPQLRHPGIVEAYEVGEDGGKYYIAMEYVAGLTLDELIADGGPIEEDLALWGIRSLAEALGYAWDAAKIFHRDIKPGHVMVAQDGSLKLLNLGIGRNLNETNRISLEGEVLGTPHYMSPEQASGTENVDFRTDIYALGGTLYTMLTGQVPLEEKTASAAISDLANGAAKLVDPREFQPEISVNTVELMRRLLGRNPDDRPANWTEVVSDIDRILAGEPPQYGRADAPSTLNSQSQLSS